MESQNPVRLALQSGLILYALGEESVLFSKRSGQLYGLDRTTTLALLRLEGGEEAAAVSRDLGLEAASCQVVNQLSALLAGKETGGGEYELDLPCPLKVPAHQPGLPLYRLLSTVFAVDGPESPVAEWITPFVAHLEIGDGAPADLLVKTEAEGAGWRLLLNGVPQGADVPPERLLPLLYGGLRRFAYQSRPYLLAIHGAVVTSGDCTVLLAGQSGSGKSTLAAVLLARGFELVSDEPAVIDLDNRVIRVPLGLGLKAGSLPALADDYPELGQLQPHLRFDGQPIRYLIPGAVCRKSDDDAHRATHLIFPSYGLHSTAKIEPLGPVQRLRAIAHAGYQVPALDEQRVEQIVGWLASLDSFSLTYSSTGQALALLQPVLGRALL